MNREIAIKYLLEIHKIFNEFDIDFWLDLGTLLGINRSGNLIEWDSDIDLGVWYKDQKKLISVATELKKKSFLVRIDRFKMAVRKNDVPISISFTRIRDGKAWTLGKANGSQIIKILAQITSEDYKIYSPEKIRLFWRLMENISKITNLFPNILTRKLSKALWIFWQQSGGKTIPRVIPKHYYTKLDHIEFKGAKFKIPSNVEKYLECRYGEDWRTPKKDYKHWIDDGAIDKDFIAKDDDLA